MLTSFLGHPIAARRARRRARDVLGDAARPDAVPRVKHVARSGYAAFRCRKKVHHGRLRPFASIPGRLHDRLSHGFTSKKSGDGSILLLPSTVYNSVSIPLEVGRVSGNNSTSMKSEDSFYLKILPSVSDIATATSNGINPVREKSPQAISVVPVARRSLTESNLEPDELDLFLELDAELGADALLHERGEHDDLFRRRAARVDEIVRMHRTHLGAADAFAPEPRMIDEPASGELIVLGYFPRILGKFFTERRIGHSGVHEE